MTAWNKGLRKETDERVRKYAEKLIGNKNAFGNKVNLGRKHTEEWKRVTSEKMKSEFKEGRRIGFKKGVYQGYGFKKGIIPWNKGKEYPLKHEKQFKKGHAPWNKGISINEKVRKKCIIANKGKHLSFSTEFKKGHKFSKEIEEKRLKNSIKGLLKRPTSLEKEFIEIIEKYNLPYKYVGDGSFLIGFKNPDFVNVNGEKICIDIRHTKICLHKHSQLPEQYKKQRIEHFAKYGWKCLVFFENDLNEENILNKLGVDRY